MDNEIKKFLEFNGKAVYFLAKGGTWWVAIKPICEALNIDFDRQKRTVKADPILIKEVSLQTLPTTGGMQKFLCLPERFIYGWLFSVKSDSKQLQDYKRECYNLLFDHFHGSITSRETLIRAKAQEDRMQKHLENLLATNDHFQLLQRVRNTKKVISKKLAALDSEIFNEQIKLLF